MSDLISPIVQQFIHEQIHSVEKLEVVLLLADSPQQWWSASDVANVLYRQSNSVEHHLNALEVAGFLDKRSKDSILFRYSQTPGTYDRAVKSLSRAYRERKDTVIELIFSQTPDEHTVQELNQLESSLPGY